MVENVIWPAYLDADLTRGEGRRVPREDAVEDPNAAEIAEAVRQVGYEATVEPDATYPHEVEARGKITVRGADDSKNDLLRAVAAYVAALRD